MSSKKQTVIPINNLEAILSRIQVIPVENGAVAGPAVNAGTLWSDQITLLYVIRRPGMIMQQLQYHMPIIYPKTVC